MEKSLVNPYYNNLTFQLQPSQLGGDFVPRLAIFLQFFQRLQILVGGSGFDSPQFLVHLHHFRLIEKLFHDSKVFLDETHDGEELKTTTRPSIFV